MKILKTTLLSLFIAASLGAVSTSAVACESGRVCVSPAEGIKLVQDSIASAQEAIAAGKGSEEVYNLIKEALKFSKEINANDKVDVARNRANAHLKKARGAAKKGDLAAAAEHLNAGKAGFDALPGLL